MIATADDKAKHADLAMDWLKRAVAAGYKDVAKMKNDRDLDPLRDREDFKKLLADWRRNRDGTMMHYSRGQGGYPAVILMCEVTTTDSPH